MVSAVGAGRRPQSLAPDRRASRAASSEYDDNRLRVEESLEEMLPGRDLAADWADIDDADEADMECAVELASAYVVGEDVFVPILPILPIAPERADESTC